MSTKSILYTNTGKPVVCDSLTNFMVQVPVIHNKIHDGTYFEATYVNTGIANAAAVGMHILTCSAQPIHITFDADVNGTFDLKIWEAPVIVLSGTAITPVNKNRLSINSACAKFFHTASIDIASAGTLIQYETTSAAKRAGAGLGRTLDNEWIFKKNTIYYVQITNKSGGASDIFMLAGFYEPTVA